MQAIVSKPVREDLLTAIRVLGLLEDLKTELWLAEHEQGQPVDPDRIAIDMLKRYGYYLNRQGKLCRLP